MGQVLMTAIGANLICGEYRATITIENNKVKSTQCMIDRWVDGSLTQKPQSLFAVFCVTSTGLEGLGVGDGDYLIVNNVATDDVSGIDAECKMQYNGGGVNLTFDLTQCNPTIEQSSYLIVYTWYIRNAEQSAIKREDACAEVKCQYYRYQYFVKSDSIDTSLEKTDYGDLYKNGNFSLVLNTYAEEARENLQTSFDVPDRIYARLEFENSDNIPDTWYLQIRFCSLTEDPDLQNEYIDIIDNGRDDDSYCNVTVNAPPFVPNQEDFSFESFIWTDPDTPNQLYICCSVYLCTEDAPGVDCTDFVDPIARRKRSVDLYDFPSATVISGPITVN